MSDDAQSGLGNPVTVYKQLLKDALDRRPSGMRQRLAQAIGKNRSFVSQISNPSYATPIPAEHVDRILDVCHFGPEERTAFLDAYREAHPRRLSEAAEQSGLRNIVLDVPDFGDTAANKAFDRAVEDIVRRMARMMSESPASGSEDDN